MIWLKHNSSSHLRTDRWLAPSLGLLAALTGLILILVLAFLVKEAWPILNGGSWSRFIFDESWYPLENKFGLTPMLLATLAAGFGALFLATPIGLAGAIFISFYAPPILLKFYRVVLALLAGIPSVVYGLWGLTVLVPIIARWQAPGTSLLAAICILSLMIVPTIALTSVAALNAVPRHLLFGAAALGLHRKAIILSVVLPAAKNGIFNGVVLALARAFGETMAVLMVAGNVLQNPSSLFSPIRVLTANIALEMAYATGTHRAGLFVSGLLLTMFVLILALWNKQTVERTQHA